MQVVGAIMTPKVDGDVAELCITSIIKTIYFRRRRSTDITIE